MKSFLNSVGVAVATAVLLAGNVFGQFCNRPDGVTCENPPYSLEQVHNFGSSILSVLAHKEGTGTVYVGGSTSIGRSLYKSVDGGNTWVKDDVPNGAIYSLAFGETESELILGSLWQDVPLVPSPQNTSFAHFRDEKSGGNWIQSTWEEQPSNTRVATIPAKGLSYQNHTFYGAVTVQYPATSNPWIEFFAGVSNDNGKTFDLYPWSASEYPIFQIAMLDELNGVAIGGQHWEGDYSQPDPTEEEYIAIISITQDGGKTWEEVFHHENVYTFVDIDCIGQKCWIATMGLGYSIPDNVAAILYSEDGGRTWVEQFSTINDNDWDGGLLLSSVHFVNENVGFAVGNFRMWTTVLVTYDGGAHWNYAYEPSAQWTHITYDVYDIDGELYILAYELSTFQTKILRLVSPATTKTN